MNRYAISWCEDDTCGLSETTDGALIKYEDHIAELKKRFPDWPGEYPKEDGYYYLDIEYDCIIAIVYVDAEKREYEVHGVKDEQSFNETDPENWGPKVPMWEKI